MFPKLSLAVTAVLATLAVASPTGGAPTGPPAGNQCCSSVQTANNSNLLSGLLGLLGVIVGANVPIGLSCSPITIIGNNCGGTTVDCSGPAVQNGLIAIGCLPITL